MIFDIDEIPEGGLEFRVRKDRDYFKIDHPDCALTADVCVSGELKKVLKDVYFTGIVTTTLSVSCARCLEPVRVPVESRVSARFVPASPSRKNKTDAEVHASEVETELYSENKIDITPPVHDQILLAVSPVSLCSENCRGLCPRCGTNWNKSSCDCAGEESLDPRLEALKEFKEKLK